MKYFFSIAVMFLLTACATSKSPPQTFFDRLSSLCGKSFAGALVSDDAVDVDFKGKAMVMHVRECSDVQISIPFHVDADRSRTWIITKTPEGLQLKHSHRHKDGHSDAVTLYGGDTSTPGSTNRQEFPVDDYSIAMFKEEGLSASVVNVWALELSETQYVYELSRPGRLFRVAFDVTQEVSTPPAPW